MKAFSSLADSANGLPHFAGDELGAAALPGHVLHAAALTVCDRATDADDARMLLEAVGLFGYQRGKFRTYHFGRPQP